MGQIKFSVISRHRGGDSWLIAAGEAGEGATRASGYARNTCRGCGCMQRHVRTYSGAPPPTVKQGAAQRYTRAVVIAIKRAYATGVEGRRRFLDAPPRRELEQRT